MFMCSNKYSCFLKKKHYWKVQTGLLHLALIEHTIFAKTNQSNSLPPLQSKKKKNHYHPMFVTILLLFIHCQIDN